MVLKRLFWILSMLLLLDSVLVAETPTEFRDWNRFPDWFEEQTTVVPNTDYARTFQIGHIIFAFPSRQVNPEPRLSKSGQVIPLEKAMAALLPVDKVVVAAEPDPAYLALISQQRQRKYVCQFDKARSMAYGGEYGVEGEEYQFRWEVIWKLVPVYGGKEEWPSRISVFVNEKGKIIPYERYLSDAIRFVLPEPKPDPEVNPGLRRRNAPKVILCSTLPLEAEKTAPQPALSLSEIEGRGRKAFQRLMDRFHADSRTKAFQFRFLNVQSVRLPWSVGSDGQIEYLKLWAVNFQEVKKQGKQEEDAPTPLDLFTVWVKPDGTVAELAILGAWKRD